MIVYLSLLCFSFLFFFFFFLSLFLTALKVRLFQKYFKNSVELSEIGGWGEEGKKDKQESEKQENFLSMFSIKYKEFFLPTSLSNELL